MLVRFTGTGILGSELVVRGFVFPPTVVVVVLPRSSILVHLVLYCFSDAVINTNQNSIMAVPPIQIDGLLKLVSDGKHLFSKEEMQMMARSKNGVEIGKAISQCRGIRSKLQEAQKRLYQDPNDPNLRGSLNAESSKYRQCLSYVSCREDYSRYLSCSRNALQSLQRAEGRSEHVSDSINFYCAADRESVERCVGRLVSGTVKAAAHDEIDVVLMEPDLFPWSIK